MINHRLIERYSFLSVCFLFLFLRFLWCRLLLLLVLLLLIDKTKFLLLINFSSTCVVVSRFKASLSYWQKLFSFLSSTSFCLCVGLSLACQTISIWLFCTFVHKKNRCDKLSDNPKATDCWNSLDSKPRNQHRKWKSNRKKKWIWHCDVINT